MTVRPKSKQWERMDPAKRNTTPYTKPLSEFLEKASCNIHETLLLNPYKHPLNTWQKNPAALNTKPFTINPKPYRPTHNGYCPHTVTVYNRATTKLLMYLCYVYYPTVTEWGQYPYPKPLYKKRAIQSFFLRLQMGGCQNDGPFLGPYYNMAPNI